MSVKASEIRSGLFVVLATGVLCVLVFSVGNFRARFRPAARYHAYLSDAKFLKAHDAVTYGGLRVGQVKRVEVAPDRFGTVRVTVEVDPEIPVREDSTLVLKQDGMLGPKYLEILPGTPAARPAAPGAELAALVPPALTDLTSAVEKPLQRIDRVLEHLDRILGLPENQKNLAELLAETRAMLGSLHAEIRRVGALAEETGRETRELLAEIRGAVRDARAPLTNALQNAEALSEKLSARLDDLTGRFGRAAEALERLLRDADGLVVENHKNVYETIRALRDAAYHMEQASKRIRANPSILLFGAEETPEERRRADETELRLRGRARRYDKEPPKE